MIRSAPILLLFVVAACAARPVSGPPPVTGEVVRVEDGRASTDLGLAVGIHRGMVLSVFDVRSEERHPQTGRLLRVHLEPVGEIRIEGAIPEESWGTIRSGGKAIRIGQYVRPSPIPSEPWTEDARRWWASLNVKNLPPPGRRGSALSKPYPTRIR